MVAERKQGKPPDDESNVISLAFRNGARIPSLTDDEVLKLRAMLVSFNAVCTGCPMARHITKGNP